MRDPKLIQEPLGTTYNIGGSTIITRYMVRGQLVPKSEWEKYLRQQEKEKHANS